MKKSDLKTGMRVKLRNELELIVALDHFDLGDSMVSKVTDHLGTAEYTDLPEYDEDLLDREDSAYDVMKVWTGKEVLFEREEIEYKNLTPKEAMIKLMNDGEFRCEVRDSLSNDWESCKLIGVRPYTSYPFIAYLGCNYVNYNNCRIKL